MKLPSFRRIYKDDFQEDQKPLVEKLSFTINQGFEQLFLALGRNVSLSDNVACTVKDVEVEVDSSGFPKIRTTFKLDSNSRVTQVVVGKADNLTNTNVYPTSGVFISWTQVDEGILINHIAGLPANNKFRLRVTAYN